MKSSLAQRITALCFAFGLISMFLITLVGQGIALAKGEETELGDVAAGHEIEKDRHKSEEEKSTVNPLAEMMDGFSSSIPGKKEGAAFATAVTKAVSGNTYIESSQVMLGKENWLFYKRADDGDPVQDYQGDKRYSQEEMDAAAQNLSAHQDYFKEHNAQFAAVYIPNKANVYPEMMPDTIVRSNEYSRGQEMMDYIKKNTSVNLVNTTDVLMETRKDKQVYYSTDTHFNEIGAFVCAMDIMKAFGLPTQSLSSIKFNDDNKTYAGDLAILCSMTDVFAQDTEYRLDPSSVDPSVKNGKSILVIGDSFGERLSGIFSEYFGRSEFVNVWSFTPELLDEMKPDYVIWETVERYADRYSWQNLVFPELNKQPES